MPGVTIPMTIKIPKVPTKLSIDTGGKRGITKPTSSFSRDELMAVGEQWTADLIEGAGLKGKA